MGHILITVVYLPIDLLKAYYRKHPHKLRRVPTEVIWEILTIREDHPKFLTDLDRRETMAMLAGGTGGALVIGASIFFKTWTFPCEMFVLVGVLLLIDFVTAMPHLQRVREAIIEANANTKKPEPPQGEGVKQALIDLIKAATDAVGRL